MPKTPRRGRTLSPSSGSERSEESVPASSFRQFSTGSLSSGSSRGRMITKRELREARYEHEAQLEAERHWWLERSEGQVKELQTVFRADFDKASLYVNARIAACEERFEQLLETEKEERHAASADLRTSFVSQGNSIHPLQNADGNGASEHQLREAHGLIGQLRNDHALGMAQQASLHASLTADKEQQRELISSLEVSMQFLKHDLSKVDAASFELQDVRLSSKQTADACIKGIEDVYKAVAESERNLRLEMQAALAALGAAEGGLRQELCDGLAAVEAKLAFQLGRRIGAIGQSASMLTESIDDERDQRALESNTLRSKLDAVASQLGMSRKASATPHSSVSREEIDPLSEQVESLQDGLQEARAKQASVPGEGARYSEQIVTINRVLSSLSEQVSSIKETSSAFEKRSAEDLATERIARAAETLEIRLLAEEASRQAQLSHTNTGISNPVPRPGRLSRSPMLNSGKTCKPVPGSPATLNSPAPAGPVNSSSHGAVQRCGSIVQAPGSVNPGYGPSPSGIQAVPRPVGQAKLRQIDPRRQQTGLPPTNPALVQARGNPTAAPEPYGARR